MSNDKTIIKLEELIDKFDSLNNDILLGKFDNKPINECYNYFCDILPNKYLIRYNGCGLKSSKSFIYIFLHFTFCNLLYLHINIRKELGKPIYPTSPYEDIVEYNTIEHLEYIFYDIYKPYYEDSLETLITNFNKISSEIHNDLNLNTKLLSILSNIFNSIDESFLKVISVVNDNVPKANDKSDEQYEDKINIESRLSAVKNYKFVRKSVIKNLICDKFD